MQIPFLEGTKTTGVDYESVFPLNLMAVPKDTGVSQAYLNVTDGIVQSASVAGDPRGAIVNTRDGRHYRVHQNSLYEMDAAGTATTKGSIQGSGYAAMTYGFDHVAIAAGGKGYSWNGTALSSGLFLQADPTITYAPIDVAWVQQFFLWTDGDLILQSGLTNPLSITGFADAESSPDKITGLVATRDELLVCGKTTIERFRNVGTGTFTFRSVPGGVLDKGVVSASAKVRFSNTFAFVGGGAEENTSVWIYGGSQAQKIATRDIENAIADIDATLIVMDYHAAGAHQLIIVRLPNGISHVYDMATQQWHRRNWDAQNIARAYGKTWVGGNGRIGYLDEVGTEWGANVRRECSTKFLPTSQSFRMSALELKGNWGRFAEGSNPQVELETSFDGIDWSQPRIYSLGQRAIYDFRPKWRNVAFLRGGRHMAMRFSITCGDRYQIAAIEVNE